LRVASIGSAPTEHRAVVHAPGRLAQHPHNRFTMRAPQCPIVTGMEPTCATTVIAAPPAGQRNTPPVLTPEQLRHAQQETLAAPRTRYDVFSRVLFFTIDVLYGRRRSLEKFLVLEQLAQIPYRVWERLAQRAIARSEGRSALALHIMRRVAEARAQQDNELLHLLVLEELAAQQRTAPLGRFRYRILPRVLAAPWHLFCWMLHLLRPEWSYQLNARFEDHAEHEYMAFVAEHPELDWQTINGAFAANYGPFATVADVLRQIGHDERVHKLESLASCALARTAPPTNNGSAP
jgi:ubiquinol oxidase